MEAPYNGQTGRTTSEPTTVWCGGCGIWFGSSVYSSIDAETDASLIAAFLSDGFAALNTCVCPSCSWRHIAHEAIAIHYPQRRQFFLYVPSTLRHRAQTIRADFLASVTVGPGVHVPRYVFEPVLVGSRTELTQLIGDERVFTRGVDKDYSSLDSSVGDMRQGGLGGSVVQRSHTLNLLAEIVGEEPDEGQRRDAIAEIDKLARDEAHNQAELHEALTTQREFEVENQQDFRTSNVGLLAAELDSRSQTQSIVMPEGVTESLELNRSQLDFEDDYHSEHDLSLPDDSFTSLGEDDGDTSHSGSGGERQIGEVEGSLLEDELEASKQEEQAVSALAEDSVGSDLSAQEEGESEEYAESSDSIEAGADDFGERMAQESSGDLLEGGAASQTDGIATSDESADNLGGAHQYKNIDEISTIKEEGKVSVVASADDVDAKEIGVIEGAPESHESAEEPDGEDEAGVLETSSIALDDAVERSAENNARGDREPSPDTNGDVEPTDPESIQLDDATEGSVENLADDVEELGLDGERDESSADADSDDATNHQPKIDCDSRSADARQAVITGSVELAPDYTQELEEHSRPPSPEMAEVGELESTRVLPSHRIEISDIGVVLRSSVSSVTLNEFAEQAVEVLPQLHEFESGCVCTLTLFKDTPDQESPIYWVVDKAAGRDEILSQLEANYGVVIELECEGSNQRLTAEYRFPLESNISAMKRKLDRITASQEEAAVRSIYTDGEFTSSLTHNFERDSFSEIRSAGEAALAVGIVGFWSSPERSSLLWSKLGFPLDWWQEIQSRVFGSATDFGLPFGPELTPLALSILDLDDEKTYLQTLIDNFLEVNLRIKPNGLDIVEMAQVWDRLLGRAQELGLSLDPEVEELASQALDRGEIALDDEDGHLDDSIEVSLADALEVASIGGVNLRDLAFYERETLSIVGGDLAGVSNAQLAIQLADSEERLGAFLALVNNGAFEYAEQLFETLSQMSAAEVSEALPVLVQHANTFQGLFRGGLFADSHATRLASAVYLIETGDERVINPLLAMILDPEESEWEALVLSAVSFGHLIAKPALARVSLDTESATRVAYLLTAVEGAKPGTLEHLSASCDETESRACVQAALGQIEKFDNLFATLEFSDRISLTLSSVAS